MKLTDFMVQYMNLSDINMAERFIIEGTVYINDTLIGDTEHYMENTSRVQFVGKPSYILFDEAWFCVGKEK